MKRKNRITKKPLCRAFLVSAGIAALSLAAGCQGSASVLESGYKSGTFTGTGSGCRGPIVVQVQTSSAGIEDIAIISHRETPNPGLAAMEELLDLVLDTGSVDQDVISGASLSSRGFLEAVENALARAR